MTKSCERVSYVNYVLKEALALPVSCNAEALAVCSRWFDLVYWGWTPQQQPGSYQGGEMMMKSVFWWRKPEYPEETTDLRQVTAMLTNHFLNRMFSWNSIVGFLAYMLSKPNQPFRCVGQIQFPLPDRLVSLCVKSQSYKPKQDLDKSFSRVSA